MAHVPVRHYLSMCVCTFIIKCFPLLAILMKVFGYLIRCSQLTNAFYHDLIYFNDFFPHACHDTVQQIVVVHVK